MAKGLLFALVRKGSKLNYLDDGNNLQCDKRKRKQSNENCKAHSKVNRQGGVIKNGDHGARKSSEQFETSSEKSDSKRRGRKLFDLTLQKLSKGCKSSPVCVNNGTISPQGTGKQRDTPKPGHPGKAMVVPSVASGYFVHETSNNNRKEATLKMQENELLIPRIAVTDHKVGYFTPSGKTVETNRPCIHYSRYSSLPQLRVDERRKRPAWTKDESSSQFSGFTNQRASVEPQISKVEAEPSGLFIEAIPISASPSTSRKNQGSANSLRSQCSQTNRSDIISVSYLDRCWKGDSSFDTKNCLIKRASSWSRGDEKSLGLTDERQNSRKINIFLPTL